VTDAPSGSDSPFRGGYRFVPGDAGVTTVDVWGADLTELLPRAAEAAFRAAGTPRSLAAAPAFRIEVRAEDAPTVIGAVVVTALGLLAREGRWASEVACRSVVSVEPGGTLPPGVGAVLVCGGGHVDRDRDPGLRRLAVTDDAPGVWEENGILRARFHVREEAT